MSDHYVKHFTSKSVKQLLAYSKTSTSGQICKTEFCCMDNSLLFVSLVYVYLNYPRGQNRYVVKKTIIKKKKKNH